MARPSGRAKPESDDPQLTASLPGKEHHGCAGTLEMMLAKWKLCFKIVVLAQVLGHDRRVALGSNRLIFLCLGLLTWHQTRTYRYRPSIREDILSWGDIRFGLARWDSHHLGCTVMKTTGSLTM